MKNDTAAYRVYSRGGRLLFVAETFAMLLLFLLPLKFGAIIGLPAVTMIYWRELFPLAISPWPSTLFPPVAALLLLTTIFCVPKTHYCTRRDAFAMLWALIAGLSPLGAFAAGVIVNYPMHMIPYCFGLAAFSMAFAILLDSHPRFGVRVLGVIAAASVFSLYSAVVQSVSGFEMTLEQVKKLETESGVRFHPNMLTRLKEQRVSADFSACNAYAGYLLLVIPILLSALWRLGGAVHPPKVSRIIFTVPVFCVSMYILCQTGSRGALLSGGAMLFACLLCLKLPPKWKHTLLGLIPLGVGAFVLVLALGRGAKSMIFRFDYDWAAFRMMLEHPFFGTGWGGFVRHYLKMKLLVNNEAPNSPHNLMLTIGSQLGVPAFLLSVLIVAAMFAVCWHFLKHYSLKESLTDPLILRTGAVFGLAAWTFHSMMEVSFETPGSMATAIAVTIAVMTFPENMRKEPETSVSPFLWKATLILVSLVLILCTLFAGMHLVRFELAFEQLNNLTDTRFMTEEQRSFPPDPALVLKAAEDCDRIASRSPYQMMTLSSYFLGRGDRENAEKYLDEAIRRAPAFDGLYFRKYRMLKEDPARAADAEKALETARKLSPMNPDYKEEN